MPLFSSPSSISNVVFVLSIDLYLLIPLTFFIKSVKTTSLPRYALVLTLHFYE